MDSLKSALLYAGTIGTIFICRSSLAPQNPLSLFLLGIAASHFCIYVLPLRYNLANPWVVEFTRRRVKRAKKVKNKSADGDRDGKLGSYEQRDMYGLEHAFMNLDLEPQTMWKTLDIGRYCGLALISLTVHDAVMLTGPQNVQNAGGSFPKACSALSEELLKVSGALENGPVSLLEVGCGCAEAAIHLLKTRPETFANYVGLNINKTQAEFCATRLKDWQTTHNDGKSSTISNSSILRAFHANAATPSSWPKEIAETANSTIRPSVSLSEMPTGNGSSRTWMLALDTLYHFMQGREESLTYASQQLGTSLIATDFILQDNLSFAQRWGLRATLYGIQVPWSNRITQPEYIDMLVRCGYERDSIQIIDISQHVFLDYANFLSERAEKWDDIGGSPAFARPFTLFRWVLRYWAKAGTISQSLIVAHSKK